MATFTVILSASLLVHVNGNSEDFVFSDTEMTFSKAMKFCQLQNLSIPIFRSKDDFSPLWEILPRKAFWLNGNHMDRGYRWTSTAEFVNHDLWCAREPNCHDEEEECGLLAGLTDENGPCLWTLVESTRHHAICKKTNQSSTGANTCTGAGNQRAGHMGSIDQTSFIVFAVIAIIVLAIVVIAVGVDAFLLRRRLARIQRSLPVSGGNVIYDSVTLP